MSDAKRTVEAAAALLAAFEAALTATDQGQECKMTMMLAQENSS